MTEQETDPSPIGTEKHNADHGASTKITPVSLIKQFGLFLGWLSGVLVGITGLFYAIGFVATIANLSFLGLDLFLIDYDPFIYLARGANILIFMALEIGELLIVLSPFIIAYPVIRRGLEKLGEALKPSSNRTVIWVIKRAGPYVQPAIYALLFAYVYIILHAYISDFRLLFGVTNVLHNPDPIDGSAKDSMKFAMLCSDAEALKAPFLILSVATILAAFISLLAFRVTAEMRSRQVLMIPFVGVLLTFVFLLPAIYGLLFLQRELVPVSLVMADSSQSEDYYLLGRDGQEFVVWNPDILKTLVFSAKSAKITTIGGRVPLRQAHPALRNACDLGSRASGSGGD
jgi:hypothetical protein